MPPCKSHGASHTVRSKEIPLCTTSGWREVQDPRFLPLIPESLTAKAGREPALQAATPASTAMLYLTLTRGCGSACPQRKRAGEKDICALQAARPAAGADVVVAVGQGLVGRGSAGGRGGCDDPLLVACSALHGSAPRQSFFLETCPKAVMPCMPVYVLAAYGLMESCRALHGIAMDQPLPHRVLGFQSCVLRSPAAWVCAVFAAAGAAVWRTQMRLCRLSQQCTDTNPSMWTVRQGQLEAVLAVSLSPGSLGGCCPLKAFQPV